MITGVNIHPQPDDRPVGRILSSGTATLYLGQTVVVLGDPASEDFAAYLRALVHETTLLLAELNARVAEQANAGRLT